MSATDELRRLLDERGVEHDDTYGLIEFYGEDGSVIVARNSRSKDGILYVHAYLTPEQAVEATLGRGTCRIAYKNGSYGGSNDEVCSECGEPFYGVENLNYCPNCGRRVVDE